MMMTRWKLTAGILGVSLCGLAAMANSSSTRTRSALGCYKAEDSQHFISAPPTPTILKTHTDSLKQAAAPPINIQPINPPPTIPTASIPVVSTPLASEPPAIPPAIPVASTAIVPTPTVTPAPIDVPLPKIDTLQSTPTTIPPSISPVQAPAVTVPVQPVEASRAVLPTPLVETPGPSVGIPPVMVPESKTVQLPLPTPASVGVPQPPQTQTVPPTATPIPLPSAGSPPKLEIPSIASSKEPVTAPQTAAKPDVNLAPVLPDLSKSPDVKQPEPPVAKTAAPLPPIPGHSLNPAPPASPSQDDGVKVVVKMSTGRPTLTIISEGAELMTLTCEQLDLAARIPGEESTSEIKASGKVTFTAPGCQGQCDELVLNPKTWDGTMLKGVRVKCQQSQRESELSADKMTFKLRSSKDSIVPTISASHSEPSNKK